MLQKLLEYYEPALPQRGVISNVVARRNASNNVLHMSFQLDDPNRILVVNSVNFVIRTAGGVLQSRHTLFDLVGTLPGNRIGVVARDIPLTIQAESNDRLVATCMYTDEYGQVSAAGEATFTTDIPEQPGTATLTFPNANSVRSELSDPNGVVAIQLCEFILPGGSALNVQAYRLSDGRWRGEAPLGTFGDWTCNWTYSDSLGSGKTATASATRTL